MIRLKFSVKLYGLQPQLVLAAQVADAIWRQHDILECWITSANDGQHKVGSKHYDGNALDFRTRNIPTDSMKHDILATLAESLGKEFDVLLESENTPNEHIHVEYDPK